MALDMEVLVTCPDDEEAKKEPAEAVLRISDTALALWRSYRHKGSAFWLRWTFRPFRGPWPVQFLLTVFFAPTILFGRRNVRWVIEDGGESCLRITPFVPSEFWVDIRFRSKQDSEVVAGLIEQFWRPGKAERKTSRVRQFLCRWWQAVAIPALLTPFIFKPLAGDVAEWGGVAGFMVCVVILMVVEVVSYRKDRPPQGRSNGPVVAPD